jgi:hypothetical protein
VSATSINKRRNIFTRKSSGDCLQEEQDEHGQGKWEGKAAETINNLIQNIIEQRRRRMYFQVARSFVQSFGLQEKQHEHAGREKGTGNKTGQSYPSETAACCYFYSATSMLLPGTADIKHSTRNISENHQAKRKKEKKILYSRRSKCAIPSYDTISNMGGFSESDLAVLIDTLNKDLSEYATPGVELAISPPFSV